MEDKLESAFPNIFYDLIVFVAPSFVLLSGIILGLNGWPIRPELRAIDVFVVLLVLIFFGYEYGRMVETLSAALVSKPIRFLQTKNWCFRNKDFNSILTNEVAGLPLSSLSPDRQGSKWTIYFFASVVAPELGRDLLKRHAWEKLARSSAMTFSLLFCFSSGFLIARIWTDKPEILGTWGFGSIRYTAAVGVLTLATSYEYYQRNCWNNDLLCKTLPVLIYAANSRNAKE